MIRVCVTFTATAAGVQSFDMCDEFEDDTTEADWYERFFTLLSRMIASNYEFSRGSRRGQAPGRLGDIVDYDVSDVIVTPV